MTLLHRATSEAGVAQQRVSTAVMFTGMQIGVAIGTASALMLTGSSKETAPNVLTPFLFFAVAIAIATLVAITRLKSNEGFRR